MSLSNKIAFFTLFLSGLAFPNAVLCTYQDTNRVIQIPIDFGPQGQPPPGIEITISKPAFTERLRWDFVRMYPLENGQTGWHIFSHQDLPTEYYKIRSIDLTVPFEGTEPTGSTRPGSLRLKLWDGHTLEGEVTCKI